MNKIEKRLKRKGPLKLARARRLRHKRKLANRPHKRARVAAKGIAPRGGHQVRNLERVPVKAGNELCRSCMHNAHLYSVTFAVTWEHWHHGVWKKATRRRCDKHAAQLARSFERLSS